MEKIKNIVSNLLEKINDLIKNVLGNNGTKMLLEENYYVYKMVNRQIVNGYNEGKEIHVGEIGEAIFKVAGLELPIGSFKIEGKNIEVNEEVIISEDGEMYMRGKPICNNSQIKADIARQIKQNGDITQPIRVDESGNLIRTNPEVYRNESYDEEARKRTEKVSEYYRNKEMERGQENIREEENQQEEEVYR
ncbi:MAG: hypothetical protein HFJ59_03090 [Clostridia bacterium]|nr:hypothetical protein [Clostridia bacterium]